MRGKMLRPNLTNTTRYRGAAQAALVTSNISQLLADEPLQTYDNIDPPAIHLTLGIVSPLSTNTTTTVSLFIGIQNTGLID